MPVPELVAPTLDALHVLVIEDDERYRTMLIDMLDEMECRATGLPSAAPALETLTGDHGVDLILLDLNLPVMDGLTFLSQLRQRGDETPVIVLTGHGDLPAAQVAIRHGISEFLTKPCHLGQIEAALARVRRARAQRDRCGCDGHVDPVVTITPRAGQSIADLERDAIVEALRRQRGNRTESAAELGISRRTLYNRIEQYRREGVALPYITE